MTATNTHLFCYNNQTFQSIQRSESDETASFLGVGRCDLHDYGHGHRLQTEIRERKDKKAYVHVTAAGLRMKDSVMGTVTTVQENAADILASAKELNEDRAAKEAEEAAAANLESEEA